MANFGKTFQKKAAKATVRHSVHGVASKAQRKPLRSGTLRVFVDDEPVLEEALSGRVTKKILNLRLRKGSMEKVLDITPGEHVIRVEVDGSGYDGARRIRGVFKSGETRHLDATVDGLIKKDLTLVWGG